MRVGDDMYTWQAADSRALASSDVSLDWLVASSTRRGPLRMLAPGSDIELPWFLASSVSVALVRGPQVRRSDSRLPVMAVQYTDRVMRTIAEFSEQQVRLPAYHVHHLQHLVAEWELLADLFFADLLLLVPESEAGERFIVLAHVRPTNSETTYSGDPVGQVWSAKDKPWIAAAWQQGQIVGGDIKRPSTGDEPGEVTVQAVPVRLDGRVIAVLSRERYSHSKRLSSLERTYAEIGLEIAHMIAEGSFPYREGGPVLTETVRVGDGLVKFDADLRVRYISPNGTSALHRLGVFETTHAKTFRDLGIGDSAVRGSVASRQPQSDEIEVGDVSVLLLSLPLCRKGRSRGAIVLLRDVSEIRRRDRLLMSKEATIREIHHRVKNNLQTIASLLQLRARRSDSAEVAETLGESVRRIQSIALVHELLSRDSSGWVPFNSIVQPLVRDVEEGLVGERDIRFVIEGEAGDLPAEIATPLAVILTELLQNAVEHAFPSANGGKEAEPGHVQVRLECHDVSMVVEVADDGEKFPPDFEIARDAGLGLKIVHTLVTSELNGSLDLVRDDEGERLRLAFPVPYRPPLADYRLSAGWAVGSGSGSGSEGTGSSGP